MFGKIISTVVFAAAIIASVQSIPAPNLTLQMRAVNNTNTTTGPANNGTRNYTIGNNTFFNQSMSSTLLVHCYFLMPLLGNGAEAACTRGFTRWCTGVGKRSLESRSLSGFFERDASTSRFPDSCMMYLTSLID